MESSHSAAEWLRGAGHVRVSFAIYALNELRRDHPAHLRLAGVLVVLALLTTAIVLLGGVPA